MDWKNIKKGDIINVDFSGALGSEQGGIRPALIVQNDVGNFYSPTVSVVPLTSKAKPSLPTHFTLYPNTTGLKEVSIALFEQVRTLDKKRFICKIGKVNQKVLENIDKCLAVQFGICVSN